MVKGLYERAIALQSDLFVLGGALDNLTGVLNLLGPHNPTMAAAKELIDKQASSEDPGERMGGNGAAHNRFQCDAAYAPACT